ncbi:MAG TPA: glycosyltransferase family 9 protein [Gemmatimonadaceae bacterium]|nr:glycosyltransferase family 9 protein [Gemmatimonadaceae bacterium]
MPATPSLKRFIPFRARLFEAREALRRFAAIRRARGEARSVIQQVRRLREREPSRPICGILLAEHMGDIIACEPVVAWARQRHTGARIVWIVKPAYAELVTTHPGIDQVFTIRSLASLTPIIQSAVFDQTIDLHVNNRPTGIDGVRHLKTWGDPTIDTRTYVRERSLIGAFSKAAGIEELSGEATIHLPPSVRESVDRLHLPSRFVAIHAASNDPDRDWMASAWTDLVGYIESCGVSVVEVGLDAKLPPGRFVSSLCGRLTLLQTADVIRRAGFFIGIDSGPAHMANAWHTPSLILLSRFKGHDWRPYEGFFVQRTERVLLRHPGPLATLTASQVIERLRADEDWLRLAGAGISAHTVE